MAYIDTKYLFKCETCRHHISDGCNTWCENGECYSPNMTKIPTADGKGGGWCEDFKNKVEIERLEIELKTMRGAANSFKSRVKTLEMDNAQLHSDVINANQNFDHVKRLWESEKEKVEKAKQKVINICKELQEANSEIEDLKADKEALINGQLTLQKMYLESRAKAVMELAEIIIADYPEMEYYLKDILKEMTEEQTNPT